MIQQPHHFSTLNGKVLTTAVCLLLLFLVQSASFIFSKSLTWDETKYLGIGIASVVNFLNPEMIILGGGVVEALDDKFLDRIRKFAVAYALPNTMDGVEIATARLGDDAGVIGASVLARQHFGDNQLS